MGGPILPALRERFNLAPAEIGLITSAFPLGMFAAVFIFPALSDFIGRKPVLLISYLGVGAGFILQAAAIHYRLPFGVFLALRVLSGAFAGATTVVKAYIADVSDRETLPKAMAYREAAGTLSYIVGPTLGGLLFALSSLSFVVAFSGFTSVIAAVWVLIFLRSPPRTKPALSKTSDQRASGAQPANEGMDAGGSMKKSVLHQGVVPIMICIHFLYNFGQSSFESFFAVICAERFGLQPAVLGPMLTSLACLVFLNSTFMYSRFVRRFGLVPIAIVGLLLITSGLVSLGLSGLRSLRMSRTPWPVFASMLFYGFGVPYFTPSVPTILAQSAPRESRGFILGVDSAVSSVARIISPILMGLLYQLGPVIAFWVAGMVVLFGAFLMALQQARLSQVI